MNNSLSTCDMVAGVVVINQQLMEPDADWQQFGAEDHSVWRLAPTDSAEALLFPAGSTMTSSQAVLSPWCKLATQAGHDRQVSGAIRYLRGYPERLRYWP